MKEIKFRCWDDVDECMFFQEDCYKNEDFDFNFTPCGLELLVLDEKWCSGSGEWESSEYMRSVDSAVFMQFTGLQDKNGVDIYAGDVVECWTLSPLGETEQSCTMVASFEYGSFLALTASDNQLVIGNIHQNPELLES